MLYTRAVSSKQRHINKFPGTTKVCASYIIPRKKAKKKTNDQTATYVTPEVLALSPQVTRHLHLSQEILPFFFGINHISKQVWFTACAIFLQDRGEVLEGERESLPKEFVFFIGLYCCSPGGCKEIRECFRWRWISGFFLCSYNRIFKKLKKVGELFQFGQQAKFLTTELLVYIIETLYFYNDSYSKKSIKINPVWSIWKLVLTFVYF